MKRGIGYGGFVKPQAHPAVHEALDPDLEPEPGYADWKRAKVERALAQTAHREEMIPAAQVWRDLGLER